MGETRGWCVFSLDRDLRGEMSQMRFWTRSIDAGPVWEGNSIMELIIEVGDVDLHKRKGLKMCGEEIDGKVHRGFGVCVT